MLFKNRREAGRLLAQKLEADGYQFDMILAVPRGGIVVADEIANRFHSPLDVVLARKIGSPDLPEYAVGAVTPDGNVMIHEKVREFMDIKEERLRKMAESVQKEINYRLDLYRSFKQPLNVQGQSVLLVDDGIATGFTMKAAINYLKREDVNHIIMAVPVTSREAYISLSKEVDRLVALEVPSEFLAVGQFYQNFSEVEDSEVIRILKARIGA